MGYVAGPIFLTIFLVLSVHSIGLLVECSRWMRRQRQQQYSSASDGRGRGQQRGKTTTTTYVDIAQSTFGNNGAILTYIASISASIGVCGSYLVFIAVNLESLFSMSPLLSTTTIVGLVEGITSVEGNNEQYGLSSASSASSSNSNSNDVTFLVIIIWTIAMPIAVMLSSVRNPKRFAAVSFWGDISVIAGMVAVLIYGGIIAATTIAIETAGTDTADVGTDDNNNDDDDDDDGRNKCVAIGSLHDMALAFGSIGYLFLVHFLILPIESSMVIEVVEHEHDDEINLNSNRDINSTNNNNENHHHHHLRFMKVVKQTFTVCGFIGGSFGIAGYLLFGSDTQQIVLMNVVSGDNGSGMGIMATVQFLLCIDLILTYPVVMRPSIVILEQQLLRHRQRHRHRHRHRGRRQGRQTARTGTDTTTTITSSSSSPSPPRFRLTDNRYRSNKRNNVDDDVNDNNNSNNIDNDIDNNLHTDDDDDSDNDNIEWTTHIIICLILGIVAASAGSFIPAFGLLSGLVGGVSQTFLAFVLPPLMWSKIQQKQKKHQRSSPTSTFTTSSSSNDAVWVSSFYYLPRKEKMLVLCGFGLILWTLHSTWSELN
jgi:amino acid permease